MKKLSLIVLPFVLAGCFQASPKTPVQVPPGGGPPAPQNQGGYNPSLNRLDLSGQGISVLPPRILKDATLVQLDISNNDFTGALPAEIRHLTALQVLDASNNRMTGVPAEVGQLSNLRQLNLSNNKLTGIPHEIGNLRNLEVLNLSGNKTSQQDLAVIKKALPATTKIIE